MGDTLSGLRGTTVYMARGRAGLTVGEKLGQGAQGVVHEASFGGGVYAIKWFRPGRYSAELRASLEGLVYRDAPHESFIWPFDMVESTTVPGFGYVMPKLGDDYVSFARCVDKDFGATFQLLITLGQQFVSAFLALHGSGLCYRDFNSSNLWVEPKQAKVAIIDIDNVGLDSGRSMVLGTPGFMAPEIVSGDGNVLPSSVTDLHSLAVTLFWLMVKGNPLDGRRTEPIHHYETSMRSKEVLIRRYFGRESLFIFDPADDSNRPPDGAETLAWWPVYPRFLRDMFEKAFTAGLSPGGLGRVTEGEWRRALARLGDYLSVCSCSAPVFYDPDDLGKPCWNCQNVPPTPSLLLLPGRKVVLTEGKEITSNLLHRDGRDTVIGRVEAHPSRAGEVALRNVGPYAWTMIPVGQEPVQVAPSKRLHVRPMSIEFGSVRASISAG